MGLKNKFHVKLSIVRGSRAAAAKHRALNKDLSFRREKVLEKDRVRRRNVFFSFFFLLAVVLALILVLALKPSVLQDSHLINNIELLSNNEDLGFYDDIEFYQWLDISQVEQP